MKYILFVVTLLANGATSQVGICHFPGHRGDFTLQNQNRNAPHDLCEREGGNDIFVGNKRACESHGASPNPAFPDEIAKACNNLQ